AADDLGEEREDGPGAFQRDAGDDLGGERDDDHHRRDLEEARDVLEGEVRLDVLGADRAGWPITGALVALFGGELLTRPAALHLVRELRVHLLVIHARSVLASGGSGGLSVSSGRPRNLRPVRQRGWGTKRCASPIPARSAAAIAQSRRATWSR